MDDLKILQLENNFDNKLINEILKEVNNDFKPPLEKRINIDDYSQKLFNNSIIYFAKKDDIYIGFIAFYCNNIDNKIAYIPMLAIKSEFRGQGIGSKLLDAAILYIRDKGFLEVHIETWEGNKVIDLYQKKGFIIKSVISDRKDNIRSVKMELKIN